MPRHSDLSLSENVCRVASCGANFESWQSRQRHERVAHKFIFRRSFSFAPFNVRYATKVNISGTFLTPNHNGIVSKYIELFLAPRKLKNANRRLFVRPYRSVRS